MHELTVHTQGILCFFTALIAVINIVETTSSNLIPPGYDIEHMTKADIDERTLGSKLILVVEECQMIVIWGTKVCLLTMYHRFTTLKKENIAIKIIAAYVVLSFILMQILYLGVWCRPFHNYWSVFLPFPAWSCLLTMYEGLYRHRTLSATRPSIT